MSTGLAAPASRPWWRHPAKSDRWAIYWILIVPGLLFIVPALFGHPAIDADNLIQNFPLRVLAGQQIASGHLPLLDPLTNAGTPLLGGMNAGALYPLTVIFAFIPAITAWIINMIVVYLTASTGVYALCRWHGLRTWPSFAAAICYTYSGAMVGQMVHLGVVQGYSFIPWALLLMVGLSRRLNNLEGEPSWRRLARVGAPWVVGVAVLWGLTFLSGEPRAIASIELLTLMVVPCVLLLRSSYWLRSWRLRIAYLATLAVGFAWGVGLGLVQLLPGWAFINFSERSEVNYSFYGAGSLAVRWTTLLFTPTLLGGNGAFGQPAFFANYNLAEVTGYVGVLALIAGAAFLTRCTLRGWRGADRDWVIYVVIGVIGLLATWGSFTPLGHLFRAIPLYGSTRLQSRNVILVDFPLAMFLGRWLQLVRDGQWARAGLSRISRWFSLIPVLFTIVLLAGLLGWGTWVVDKIGITHEVYAKLESGLTLVNSLFLGVAVLSVLAIVFLVRHARSLFRVLMVILVCDLALFIIFTSSGLIGGQGPREASRTTAEHLLSSNGRFALVDEAGTHTGIYRTLGEPNMNVFTHMASVQGYGALISTIYDNATGTHPQAALNACHLADGTFTQLRLGAVAISSSELMLNTVLAPAVPRSCVSEQREPTVRRYFGERLKAHELVLTTDKISGNAPLSVTPLRLRFLDGSGHAFGKTYSATGMDAKKAVFDFTAPPFAAGFELTSSSGVEIGDAVVTPYDSKWSYTLDTNFELAIATSKWHLTSTEDTFSVFKATKLIPRAWLTIASAGKVTDIRTATWGDAWVSVTLAKPSALERSEAYLPGWRATAVSATTGRVIQLKVHRAGLIEKIDVPKGKWVIHFHYHAPYIEISVAASAVSLALLIAVALWCLVQRRRRRNSKVLT
jgi:hypothetical protein